MVANGVELTRADSKAAVLLGFAGAVLGIFTTAISRANGEQLPGAWLEHVLWWSAVFSVLLAIVCFVWAIAPRRRSGRGHVTTPSYFEHITPELVGERRGHAFERVARDPVTPMLSSLVRTSEIIRAKYLWIETGTALLLVALPQFAVLAGLLRRS